MSEIPVVLKAMEQFESRPSCRVVLELKADEPFTVFPIGFKYPAGEHRLQIISDAAGSVVFKLNDEAESEPMMTLFTFVNGAFTLMSEGGIEVKIAAMLDGDEIVSNALKIYDGDIGTNSNSFELQSNQNRSIAKMTVSSDSQVSFDFYQDKARSTFGITVHYIDIGSSSGYANVYFERHKDGVWLPESRKKLGFFPVRENVEHDIYFAVVPEVIGDEWTATARVTARYNDQVKPMRGDGRVSAANITKIVVRNSGSNQKPGSYEVRNIEPEKTT